MYWQDTRVYPPIEWEEGQHEIHPGPLFRRYIQAALLNYLQGIKLVDIAPLWPFSSRGSHDPHRV